MTASYVSPTTIEIDPRPWETLTRGRGKERVVYIEFELAGHKFFLAITEYSKSTDSILISGSKNSAGEAASEKYRYLNTDVSDASSINHPDPNFNQLLRELYEIVKDGRSKSRLHSAVENFRFEVTSLGDIIQGMTSVLESTDGLDLLPYVEEVRAFSEWSEVYSYLDSHINRLSNALEALRRFVKDELPREGKIEV